MHFFKRLPKRRLLKVSSLICAATLGLAACSGDKESAAPQSAELAARDFKVVLNGVAGRPAAGYGTFSGAPDTALLSASSPEAERVELHIIERQGDVAKMRKVDALTIDSDNTLTFERGGRHLMIFGLADDAADDGVLQLSFSFDSGEMLTLNAPIMTAMDAMTGGAPKMGEHSGMAH